MRALAVARAPAWIVMNRQRARDFVFAVPASK